mgnify:FL=1
MTKSLTMRTPGKLLEKKNIIKKVNKLEECFKDNTKDTIDLENKFH